MYLASIHKCTDTHRRPLTTIIATLYAGVCLGQSHTVSGRIIDATTGEPVLYANCADMQTGNGSPSNGYGYFSVKTGNVADIRVSCIGYETASAHLNLSGDTVVCLRLTPKATSLEEVRVSSVVPMREQVMMGKNTVPVELIKSMPSLLGEPDLLRSLSYLPGVSMGKEGYSTIFVRGGDRGQDLILLDGMKIYNTGHVGGFASLFNSDIVYHVDVYKGGFPAQFGGRASSVIDVATKDGNAYQPHFKVSVGLLSSSVLLETPVSKKCTMLLAGRTSYYALFARSAKKEYEQERTGEYSDFTFYDINAKLKWRLGETSSLSLSALWSDDKMADGDGEGWYNPQTGNVRTQYSEERALTRNQGLSLAYAVGLGNVFWRTSLSASKYKSKYETESLNAANGAIEQSKNETQTQIGDVSLQSRLELSAGRHKGKGGIEIARYNHTPMMTYQIATSTSRDSMETFPPETTRGGGRSTESSVYLSDEISLGSKTSLEIGIRGTLYHRKDTDFVRVEPRIAARHLISENLSAKANYTLMNQYSHVAIERYMGFEREIWMPASKPLPPQRSHQVSAGLFYGNESTKVNASIEVFGKKMDNLVEYFPPANCEEEIANVENTMLGGGEGRAYGMEISLSKEFKRVSANIGYSLSKTERHFEQLNGGRWFPAFQDRRHELTAMATWDLNAKWSFCAMFNLSSGAPVTLPTGYNATDRLMEGYFTYDGINNRRLPTYHRLDIAATYTHKTRKGHYHKWTANVFNIYARENAAGLYYDETSGNVKKIAMTTITPSFSYTFEY